MIINPGSHIKAMRGEGWRNTIETAREYADQWLERMHADGLHEVELHGELPATTFGRWRFAFRHSVTGVVVEYETHGIDDIPAYEREHIFTPRVYWNGSSSADPEIEDFAAPGWRIHRTFIR